MTLTIPCLFGLEALVADELRRLELKNVRAENGRVHCEGTPADIPRLNINLRCGARVLLELASFPAPDFEALFQGVAAIPWEDCIPRDGEFPVKGYSISSQLHSVPACQAIVKKAAASRLGQAYGCETLPETGDRYQIQFALIKDT
ncbi:THUMP domain-containing protein, partial [uncultured Oscillibacter sp.]